MIRYKRKPAERMAKSKGRAQNSDVAKCEPVGKGFLEDDNKFALLFEKSSDPMLLLLEDVVIDCNEAALKCLHCASKDRLIGMSPWDLSPDRQPDGSPSEQKARQLLKATFNKGSNRFEWLYRTFEGEETWADISLTVIHASGRQIVHVIWRDITRQKRAEEDLIRSQLQLSDAMDLARTVHWELESGN